MNSTKIHFAAVNTVWSVIEGDEPESDIDIESEDYDDQPSMANLYAMPGLHRVNRLGFITTEVPWVDANMQAVYFDASETL